MIFDATAIDAVDREERKKRRRWAIVRRNYDSRTGASASEVALEAGLHEREVVEYYLKRIELERES